MMFFFEIQDELYRICKPDAWLVFWWNRRRVHEISKLKNFKFRYQIIELFQTKNGLSYKPIFIFAKGNPSLIEQPINVIYRKENVLFYEKIVKLGLPYYYDFLSVETCRYLLFLLRNYNLNVKCIDPFAGFGTTLFAGLKENMFFVGIEKNVDRYNFAKLMLFEEILTQF